MTSCGPFQERLTNLLEAHFQDDLEAEDFTDKQAILSSILQALFEINPDCKELSTQDFLRLRRISNYCQDLMEEDLRSLKNKLRRIS